MSFQQPSSDDRARADSLYGESSHDTREASDERVLYGEPCHETATNYDEQTLYGEPQHEIRDEQRELPDLDLLFARMRAESAAGPAVLPPRAKSSAAETTEL